MPEQKKVVIYRAGSVTSSTNYSSRAYISEDQFDDGDLIEVRSGGVAAETVIAEGGTMTVLSGGTVEGINLNTDGTFRGVGAYCLSWAYGQCGHLRIDTHGDNTVMQGLLGKLGFVHCGTIYVYEDNDPRLAYEKL